MRLYLIPSDKFLPNILGLDCLASFRLVQGHRKIKEVHFILSLLARYLYDVLCSVTSQYQASEGDGVYKS